MSAPIDIRPLTRSELPVPAARLARWLIGKTLVRQHKGGRMSGRIVETEAYVVGDASSHGFKGKTARNASLFLERGHAYVYFIYGCWFSLNVAAGRSSVGTGVLIRALEPLEGVDLMARHRPGESKTWREGRVVSLLLWTSPARWMAMIFALAPAPSGWAMR